MSSIRDVVAEVQAALVERVPGLNNRNTPVDAGLSAASFPAVLIYPGDGTWQIGPPEMMRGLHTITIEVHCDLGAGLEKAVQAASGYVYSIPDAIFGALRDGDYGHIQTMAGADYRIAMSRWGDVDTLMVEVKLRNVKVQQEIN